MSLSLALNMIGKESRGDQKIKRKVAWKGYLVESDYGKFLVSDERASDLELKGVPVEISIKEAASGMGLSGPAAFNEIWVRDGNIIGAPPEMSDKMEETGAFKTNKTFVKGFAKYAAWKIEKALDRGHTGKKYEKVKDLEGVNMKMTSKALQYILSHKKKVDIQGPLYLKFLFKINGSNGD